MERRKSLLLIGLSIVLLTLFLIPSVHAQTEYPTRPIEAVCPYPPGGANDMLMRAVVAVGGQYLGQPLIPVIRSGGAGTIGAAFVARSRPDGYTIFVASTTPLTTKPLVEKLPYKSEDFIPIGQLSASPMIIHVLASAPWKTLKEFIEDAKKNPGKFRYSTAGVYEPEHLSFEALSQMAGIKLIHVPMGGGGPALAAMLGGHVEIVANFPSVASTYITSGTVRPLAVTSAERLKFKGLEGIPTLKELGFNHENYMWIGIFVPKGTPPEIVQKLRTVVKQISDDASFQGLMVRMGEQVKYMSGEDFEKYWKREQTTIGELIKVIK